MYELISGMAVVLGTIDARIPTMPGWSASGFHQPCGRCLQGSFFFCLSYRFFCLFLLFWWSGVLCPVFMVLGFMFCFTVLLSWLRFDAFFLGGFIVLFFSCFHF